MLEAAGKSDIGQNRKINEDYYYVDNSLGLFIVCDGVGGNSAGEVASHKAIEFTLEFIQEHKSELDNAKKDPVGYYKLTQLVERAIHQTCKRVKAIADANSELSGMATTLTLLIMVDGNAIVGHVGDSRLYLKRDEQVFQLTTDHTLLNDIKSEFKHVDETQIQKFAHCLTRSIGNNETVAVETLMFGAEQHDVMLLCTDGLSNYFIDEMVVAELLAGEKVKSIADNLVDFANQCGGKDNITAIVIRVIDVCDFQLNTRRVKLTVGG